IVILIWTKFFEHKPPAQTQQTNPPPAAAPSAPGSHSNAVNAAPAVVKAAPPAAVLGDKNERTIVVESDLYRVEFSNRGGVVKSWQLKKYMDDAKPRQVLDVVHPATAQEVNGWPLSIALDDQNLENTANSALYVSSAS